MASSTTRHGGSNDSLFVRFEVSEQMPHQIVERTGQLGVAYGPLFPSRLLGDLHHNVEPQRKSISLAHPGAGKSTVARGLHAELGRGVAIVDQDTIRRKLLREHDVEGGVNIGLIEHIVRYTLASDYVVILEGILHAGRYGEMLRQLYRDFGGGWYFLQVSWEESLRRHQTRPQRAEFTPEQMLKFPQADLLTGVDERVVLEHFTAPYPNIVTSHGRVILL